MLRLSALIAALLASASPAVAQRPIPVVSTATASAGIPVRDHGLVGTWYPPADGRRGPAILALGGSDGGEIGGRYVAEALAKQGYGVLALAYFGAKGLPSSLEEVPLEYFDRALDWLKANPGVDANRIGVYGISIGGEAALVLGTRHPELRAVVAAVPSSVVWQGINMRDFTSVKSTFSEAGKPLAFVPYDRSAPFTSVLDLYQRSLATAAEHPDAAIPVERIGGSLLLVSAKDDRLWPSAEMSEQVMARLKASGFKRRHEHLSYADAGHGAMSPPSGDAGMRGRDNLGGTPEGNAAARADMWPKVLAFFADELGKDPR